MSHSPDSESALAETVRSASGPLAIRGGGTRPFGAPVEGDTLSVSGLTGIHLYEPGALTIVAAAGTPVAEIEAALAAENQMLPFEPMDHRALLGTDGTPTIGGVVATNASGPRRVTAGACRDSLIGVRFVDGRGEVIKSGGRVMKNVTGYDLVKLLCGSHGTLGVLSEVAFKVLPRPEATATLVLRNASVEDAITAMAVALGSPYGVSGAAHWPGQGTLLRLEGFTASVDERAGKLRDLLKGFGPAEIVRDDTLWTEVRDAGHLSGTEHDVWRLSVKPSDATEVAGRLPDGVLAFDWGGGLIWAALPPGTDLRSRLEGMNGHATLMRADADTTARLKTFHPEAGPLAKMATDLREKFDPRGILNPGRMG